VGAPNSPLWTPLFQHPAKFYLTKAPLCAIISKTIELEGNGAVKLSTRGRYATRAMLELALRYGSGPVLLRDIAKSQRISGKYLEQVVTPLKAAGLVNSVRGARGGFLLARPLSQIRLSQVIQVAEGSVAPVECVDDPGCCSLSPQCVAREVWVKLKESTDSVLESITLQDLVERQRQKAQPPDPMYYI